MASTEINKNLTLEMMFQGKYKDRTTSYIRREAENRWYVWLDFVQQFK